MNEIDDLFLKIKTKTLLFALFSDHPKWNRMKLTVKTIPNIEKKINIRYTCKCKLSLISDTSLFLTIKYFLYELEFRHGHRVSNSLQKYNMDFIILWRNNSLSTSCPLFIFRTNLYGNFIVGFHSKLRVKSRRQKHVHE